MGTPPYEVLEFGQVQVQVQVRPITAPGLKCFLDDQAQRIRRSVHEVAPQAPRKAVVIVDASVSLMPPAEARQVQAAWLKEHQHLLKLVTHRIGLVLPNPWLRAFMASVLTVAPQPVPMSTHGSLAAAVQWAMDVLSEINGQASEVLLRDGVAAVERAKTELTLGAGDSVVA
jgi:hypothetical protein